MFARVTYVYTFISRKGDIIKVTLNHFQRITKWDNRNNKYERNILILPGYGI